MPQQPPYVSLGLGENYLDYSSGTGQVRGGRWQSSKNPGVDVNDVGNYTPQGYEVGYYVDPTGRKIAQDTWESAKYNQTGQGGGKSLVGRADALATRGVQGARDAQDAKAKQEEEDAKASDADLQKRIQAFIDSTMSLDPNDPFAQRVAQTAQNDSSMRSEAAGLGRGGISNYASDLATKNALGGYQMQRQQMGMQGLGMLQNQRQWQRGFGENRREFNLNFQNQLDQQANGLNAQAYQSNQGQRQGIGGLIGGAVGALGFLGGPALGAATMAAGAGIGAGIGGMSGGSYQPQRPSGRGYGGSGGYGNF